MSGKDKKENGISWNISLSGIFTTLVTFIVLVTSIAVMLIFIRIYRRTMEENAVTGSEQTIVQVQNTLENYTNDMRSVMDIIQNNITEDGADRDEFIRGLVKVRSDVVAIMTYDERGNLTDCWSDGRETKEKWLKNLSYIELTKNGDKFNITKPHVESLFVDYYPWVVTLSQRLTDYDGKEIQVTMDIRFSNIANYVDDVGIGQHGYCYIIDNKGNIIYHPQQQLIYSGLKEENTGNLQEGTFVRSNVIYTVHTLENCNWRIVGVCYVDEMITAKVEKLGRLLLIILSLVLIASFAVGWIFSKLFSKPAKNLADAIGSFEGNAEHFHFKQVRGTSEINALSSSFGHMVIRIQRLMEKVREEEVILRKTELKALQAQINPHFLYNTLDAIAWLCEGGRNQDAEEMVNSLARLFRISISRGHELIPIKKEVQHAESYLKIEKFRYKNQFTYSIDVDEECLGYLCNKITLQPIIENAIYHGLNRMVDEGMIKIGIHQSGEDILFTVEDNGVGMTREQCSEILYRESGDRTGIGIKNVNDRIKIYFGSSFGLMITSELDKGTCVTIRMPKVREGEYSEK